MAPDARAVLPRYPAAVAGSGWVRLGSAGGFSGAAVWRGDLGGRPAVGLKAWPPGYPASRLAEIHRLMTAARVRAGLGFVPAVIPALSGATVVEHGGRVWDATAWMPGAADYHAAPSPAKLVAAVEAVAALHRAWAPAVPVTAPCPAVARRLAALTDFAARSFDPAAVPDPPLAALVRRLLVRLRILAAPAAAALRPWAARPVPILPCLCDVWHDHVLFVGDAVTGMIDYGEVKPDHPAVDLARLLGDLAGDDEEAFRAGVAAYATAGGPVAVDADFARLLDWTGSVCAAAHWVTRLTAGDVPTGAAERVARLAERLERFTPDGFGQTLFPAGGSGL